MGLLDLRFQRKQNDPLPDASLETHSTILWRLCWYLVGRGGHPPTASCCLGLVTTLARKPLPPRFHVPDDAAMATQRFTHKDAQSSFDRWLEFVGGRRAESQDDKGAYVLDYNPTYGGASIRQLLPGGGEREVTQRLSPRELWWAVHFLAASLGERDLNGQP